MRSARGFGVRDWDLAAWSQVALVVNYVVNYVEPHGTAQKHCVYVRTHTLNSVFFSSCFSSSYSDLSGGGHGSRYLGIISKEKFFPRTIAE